MNYFKSLRFNFNYLARLEKQLCSRSVPVLQMKETLRHRDAASGSFYGAKNFLVVIQMQFFLIFFFMFHAHNKVRL